MKRKSIGLLAALLTVLLIASAFASCTGDGEQPDGSSASGNSVSEVPSDTGDAENPSQSGTSGGSGEGASESITEKIPEPTASGTTKDDEGWSKYY